MARKPGPPCRFGGQRLFFAPAKKKLASRGPWTPPSTRPPLQAKIASEGLNAHAALASIFPSDNSYDNMIRPERVHRRTRPLTEAAEGKSARPSIANPMVVCAPLQITVPNWPLGPRSRLNTTRVRGLAGQTPRKARGPPLEIEPLAWHVQPQIPKFTRTHPTAGPFRSTCLSLGQYRRIPMGRPAAYNTRPSKPG